MHSSTGKINPLSTGLSNLPTGLAASSSTGQNPTYKRQLSDPDDSEPPEKCYVTDHNDIDESLGIYADDDTKSLISHAHDRLAKTMTKEESGPQNHANRISADFFMVWPMHLTPPTTLALFVNDKLAEKANKR